MSVIASGCVRQRMSAKFLRSLWWSANRSPRTAALVEAEGLHLSAHGAIEHQNPLGKERFELVGFVDWGHLHASISQISGNWAVCNCRLGGNREGVPNRTGSGPRGSEWPGGRLGGGSATNSPAGSAWGLPHHSGSSAGLATRRVAGTRAHHVTNGTALDPIADTLEDVVDGGSESRVGAAIA